MGTVLRYIYLTLMYESTGNEALDSFIWYSSYYLEYAAAIGIILLFILNKPLRKPQGTMNRLIFWECILVLSQNVVDISLAHLAELAEEYMLWAIYLFDFLLYVNEALYILIVYQWLICVDYSLYHSKDHLRLRYRFAALPIVAVMLLQVLRDASYLGMINLPVLMGMDTYVYYGIKLFVELGYVMTAVVIVLKYEKERREPRFLRITAFIIPFVLGVLIRYYDASFVGFGVILTYMAMRRRDEFIDKQTGLYKNSYLDYISSYWDKKNIKDANAILLHNGENEKGLADILGEINIQDCFIIILGGGCFAILTGDLRSSAIRMTEQMITEAAHDAEKPFEVQVQSAKREEGQSMMEFAARIRNIAASMSSCNKEGAMAL